MNNIESWIDRVANPPSVIITGSVSGTVTLYQPFQETLKKVILVFANYKSAASQTLILPTAFTGVSNWVTTDIQSGQLEALLSGSAQTFSVLATLGQSSTGTQNPFTSLKGWSQGMCRTAFDSIRVTNTGTAIGNTICVIEGV